MKTILVDAAGTFVLEDSGIYEPLYQLLEQYPNNKIILTNADDDQSITYGLTNLPYELFSLKHNPDKTDPKYFEIFLESHNMTADEVVYFEHDPDAVKSAQSAGIKAYHYDNKKKDMESLKYFLDNNLEE